MNIQDAINDAVGYKPLAINTFNGKVKSVFEGLPVHHVSPHYVQSHFRKGKYISGYWRDGDGDTRVDTFMGYYARNPRR
ncbi:hypothetical protein [Pseudobutyrivibrio ruminis]|uniref:hypothetical protein n=1 Tax=Pseudobutyrivibrio ruminis TaxID=46206 RepID=UPI000425649F|nr:hypothetical protein [Pseudobutyrivibrio ruminis]